MSNSDSRDDAADATVTPFRDVNADSNKRRIADDLTQARQVRGLEVRDVSNILRIRAIYLEVLEDGLFEDLPGPTYGVGFLRSYGDFLGLDGEELVRRFKDETGGTLTPQQLSFPVPASEARQPTTGIIIGTLIVAIVIAAAWYVVSEYKLVDLELVPPVEGAVTDPADEVSPAADTAALDAPADEATDEPAATDEAATVEATGSEDPAADMAAVEPVDDVVISEDVPAEPAEEMAEEVPAVEEVVSDALSDEVVAVEEAEVPPEVEAVAEPEALALPEPESVETAAADAEPLVPAEDDQAADVEAEAASDDAFAETEELLQTDTGYVPRIYGRTNTDYRVEIMALEETWIQVEAPNNVILLTRVLLPGDVYRVPNREDVTLDADNAGGLEVRVDGAMIAPLGETGVVVRNVPLAADALLGR